MDTLGFELPRYSASIPVPSYSLEPACGERTLEQTPRLTTPQASSILIKQFGKTTVFLYNQEECTKTPSYGRGGTIAGSILFDSSHNVCEVVLEIFGKVEKMTSEEGSRTITVLDSKRILWKDNQGGGSCPSQVEFSARLPLTFRDDQREERPLPPTYAVDFHGMPALFVRSSYGMRVSVTRRLSQKVGFLTKRKKMFIPFDYYPRTRPHCPIVTSPCFFSGVKSTPEEWHQAVASVKTPQKADTDPIHADLLIPSSRVYAIHDSVPFHVQLTGPTDALRTFLQPNYKASFWGKRNGTTNKVSNNISPSLFHIPLHKPSLSSRATSPFVDSPGLNTLGVTHLTPPSMLSSQLSPTAPRTSTSQQHLASPRSSRLDDASQPSFRVFFLRQVTLELRGGKKSWRNQILGEGKLVSVPPLLSTSCCSSYNIAGPHGEEHLDWEGVLQTNERYRVGGWQAAGVHVKDFIALSVLPQNERTSPLCGIQLTVPVKLVTDPWIEGTDGSAVPLETR